MSKRRPCQHLTGYWINKANGNFRCLECGCQYHLHDLSDRLKRMKRDIGEWEGA